MGQLEEECQETTIAGVKWQPLKIIPTPNGPVLHLLRQEYALMPNFPKGFGEIYFSEVAYGTIKGWKRHLMQNQLFAVPFGQMQIVLFDLREDSPTKGTILEIILGRPEPYYGLLRIPPKIWYSFKALSSPCAILCNCADIPHDPNESEQLSLDSKLIPYTWC